MRRLSVLVLLAALAAPAASAWGQSFASDDPIIRQIWSMGMENSQVATLAQVLEANGYETFCVTANSWISDGLGLTRGFAWQDRSLRAKGGAALGFSFVHRLLDRLSSGASGDLGIRR